MLWLEWSGFGGSGEGLRWSAAGDKGWTQGVALDMVHLPSAERAAVSNYWKIISE